MSVCCSMAYAAQVRRLRAELVSREEAFADAARQLEHEREQVDELERQLIFQACARLPKALPRALPWTLQPVA